MALAENFTVIRPSVPSVPVARIDAGDRDGTAGGPIYRARFDTGGVSGSEVALLMLHVSGPAHATKGARILVNGHHIGTIAPWSVDSGSGRRTFAFSFEGRLLRDIGNRIQIVDAVGRIVEAADAITEFDVLDVVCFYRQHAS